MPNVFLKIDNTFTLQDNKDQKILFKKYKKKKEYILQIRMQSSSLGSVNFRLGSETSAGGTITSQLEKSELKVVCEGVFKINVKSGLEKDFLNKNTMWLFGSFGGYEDGLDNLMIKDGLRGEEYEHHWRGGRDKMVRHHLNLKTAKAKKELK